MKPITGLMLGFLLAPMCSRGQDETSILDVRAHVTVNSASVHLADLLEASDLLPLELKESVVLAAPSSGQHNISLVDLAYKLQRYPELLNYHLRGPDFVVIERESGAEELKDVKRRNMVDMIVSQRADALGSERLKTVNEIMRMAAMLKKAGNLQATRTQESEP